MLASLGATYGFAAEQPLFTADEPLAIRLEAPFNRVFRTREDPQYQPARLTYTGADGAETTHELRVRVRGKSRAEVCSFPPLLLNFPNRGLEGSLFEGQNRLKLVTHCQTSASYEQFLMLEYLAYRVLGLLTENTLRARLVQVRYVDSERGRELASKPGIILEDEERFGERMAYQPIEVTAIERSRYDQNALRLLEVFQYFIGNTDWSAISGPSGGMCCHNVVPYARADGTLIPVPYDFDSAGIVDAPHALPDQRLPIRDVRQRLFRGPCRSPADLADAIERFRAARADIVALFDSARLDNGSRASARRYIDEFYATLDSAERAQRVFGVNC